jgi:hypothetical protein
MVCRTTMLLEGGLKPAAGVSTFSTSFVLISWTEYAEQPSSM